MFEKMILELLLKRGLTFLFSLSILRHKIIINISNPHKLTFEMDRKTVLENLFGESFSTDPHFYTTCQI